MGVVFEHNHECWPDVINGPRIMLKKINPTLENAQMFFDAVQNNIHHLKDSFDFLGSIPILIGFVLGGVIGAIALKKISNDVLKLIFDIIILVAGVFSIIKF